jgi:hypothetical protein
VICLCGNKILEKRFRRSSDGASIRTSRGRFAVTKEHAAPFHFHILGRETERVDQRLGSAPSSSLSAEIAQSVFDAIPP